MFEVNFWHQINIYFYTDRGSHATSIASILDLNGTNTTRPTTTSTTLHPRLCRVTSSTSFTPIWLISRARHLIRWQCAVTTRTSSYFGSMRAHHTRTSHLRLSTANGNTATREDSGTLRNVPRRSRKWYRCPLCVDLFGYRVAYRYARLPYLWKLCSEPIFYNNNDNYILFSDVNSRTTFSNSGSTSRDSDIDDNIKKTVGIYILFFKWNRLIFVLWNPYV